MKYINLFLSLCFSVFFASCIEDMVDTEPTTELEASTMITDESSAQLAVNGIYSMFQSNYVSGGYWLMQVEAYADNVIHTGTYPDLAELWGNAPISSNIFVLTTWRDLYSTIYRANVVISKVEGLSDEVIESESKIQIIAEAKFMRALSYFRLINLFGGVPLITEPLADDLSNLAVARNTESEVYAQIKEDLNAASAIQGGNIFRANVGAVNALKAKVHLYLKEYNEAYAAAQFFDPGNANNPYSLVGNYADLWVPGSLGNSEGIFMVNYNKDDQNAIAWFFDNISGRYEAGPSATLITLLEAEGGDRADLVQTQNGMPAILKYTDTGTGTDLPYVFRYADMLLVLAETAIEVNDDYALATNLINMVRRRSNVGDVTLDASNWKDLLMRERSVELFAEGDRWMDVRRAGIAEQIISSKPSVNWDDVKDSYNFWPIPQDEIDANSMLTQADQNPGY